MDISGIKHKLTPEQYIFFSNINNILNSSSIRHDVLMKRNKPLNNIASKEIDNYIE